MTPGPDQILACPSCGSPLRRQTLASGNTFGATFWSDGKQEAPMLPDFPAVSRCGHCHSIFWVEDAASLGEDDSFREEQPKTQPEAWANALDIDFLDADGYVEAIDMTSDPVRIQFLRIMLWHALNDRSRNEVAVKHVEPSDRFVRNLEALIQLLDETNPHERIMKAEALREIGRHADAIQLLTDAGDDLKWVTTQISALAEKGSTAVFKLHCS
jgi:hypothetical protein